MQLQQNGIPLTDQQDMALSLIFPECGTAHPDFAKIGTPLSDAEVAAVRAHVIAFLKERENYNAGAGGGSVPGRSATDSGEP